MNENDYWNEMYAVACEQHRPFILLRPRVFLDGTQWCAMYGENLQDGVAGFGDSPEYAAWNFDKVWCEKIGEQKVRVATIRAYAATLPKEEE